MINIKKLMIRFLVLVSILLISVGCTNTNENVEEPADTITTEEITPAIDESTLTTEDIPPTIEETTYPELKIEIVNDGERTYDKMDYVFIPDNRVMDKWDAVDLVQYIDEFDPVTQPEKNYLPWQSIEFYENGNAELLISSNSVTQKWTKGYILDEVEEVIPSYTVKQIGGTNYIFVERKGVDYTTRRQKPWYFVFKKSSDPEPPKDAKYTIQSLDDVRNISARDSRVSNLSLLDLTDFGENILTLTFNAKTVFPPKDKLPSNDKLQPEYILEAGKNPGLGVRSLHEQGITGKGVTVAIIDQPLFVDSHPEYKGKIIEYKDFDCESETSMHGPAVASLLVGETIGTAPGANVYYAAAPSWKGDATYFADALDWIVETSENLPDGEKIKVVNVSASPTPSDPRFENGEKYLESVKRAQDAGILVLDCSPENNFIGSCAYNFDSPEDVTLCKPVDLSRYYPFTLDPDILAPINYRTSAEEYDKGDFSYQYTGQGGWSWAVPYAAGVLAMGWEVKPELTVDEIVQILYDTAYVDGNDIKYVDPTAFIDYIKNN